jgi:hypothetical protein
VTRPHVFRVFSLSCLCSYHTIYEVTIFSLSLSFFFFHAQIELLQPTISSK